MDPATNNITVDMWPWLEEYEPERIYPAGNMVHQDGRPACLFSSRDPETVQRHFRWMRKHNIDGVYLKRFVTRGNSGFYNAPNEFVLNNVRRTANLEHAFHGGLCRGGCHGLSWFRQSGGWQLAGGDAANQLAVRALQHHERNVPIPAAADQQCRVLPPGSSAAAVGGVDTAGWAVCLALGRYGPSTNDAKALTCCSVPLDPFRTRAKTNSAFPVGGSYSSIRGESRVSGSGGRASVDRKSFDRSRSVFSSRWR